jgi:hypothetical protein
VIILAQGTQTLRSFRGAHGAAASVRVQLEAESALASAVDRWASDSVASTPLGTIHTRSLVTPAGLLVDARWLRTAPEVAWLTVDVRDGVASGGGVAFAHLTRPLRLEPPPLPLYAAITATGAIALESGSAVLAPSSAPDSTRCSREPSPTIAPQRTVRSAALPVAVTSGWSALVARAVLWSAASLPAASSDSLQPRWRAAQLRAQDSVLVGPLTWHGLLLHDGPLRLVGNITVHGLLVVRGAFDARAARLAVRGAVLIADPAAPAARFGATSTVEWDRCRVEMALATVATPRSRPFFAWQGVTP